MYSVSEAQQIILKAFQAVQGESLPLAQAAGRVLAEAVTSPSDIPLFDNSSVDGFAIRCADVTNPPQVLPVVADIRAGDPADTPLSAGTCARIMTGAALPPGADAVVMVEHTDFNNRRPGSPVPAQVRIDRAPRQGENIRHRGDDLHRGDPVLKKGTRLRAQELGMLAMLGVDPVPVHRKPRLALLSSGDELLPPGAALTPGKIRDANTFSLAALAEGCGAELIRLGVAADKEADIRSRLGKAVEAGADLIVSSAGVSVGAYDFIKPVIETEGKLEFWRVNMRPGKPLAFGTYQDIPFIGLPGNPVSAFVGFLVFVQPALEKLGGMLPDGNLKIPGRTSLRARLTETVESDGRESYLRAVVSEQNGSLVARLTGHQGSGNIFSLVQANALLIVPSGVKCVPENSDVDLWLLD